MIKKKIFALFYIAVAVMVVSLQSCKEEDYSTSSSDQLSFSVDKISLDSVFCQIPVPHKEFWVYNRTGKDILISEISQQGGSQTGFRVNVDGTYLGSNVGYHASDFEVCKGDSLRVYVEMTAPANGQFERDINDQIIFRLSNGPVQYMPLTAHAFEAEILQSPTYTGEQTIDATTPLVVYGKMTVAEGAVLHIKAGTTIYFDDEAGIDVHGTLLCEGDSTDNVVLRGRRLDNMFDYLPYDRVSGQWQGVHFYPESYNNELNYTDLHSAYDGIVCDSSNVDNLKLSLFCSIVHNSQGYCLKTTNSRVVAYNTQITNALYDCLYINGGEVILNNCTLGQFYPFDSNRGVALRYITEKFPTTFLCQNTIVTGYADDELMLEHKDTTKTCIDQYQNCVLRTAEVKSESRIINTIFESTNDSVQGEKHFKLIDYKKQNFDFHLANANSPCVGGADPTTATTVDRDGYIRRKDKPSIGCYEYR